MPTLRLDPYVIDTLMRDLVGHDRKPSAFLVYLYLWARTRGAGARSVTISHQAIADETGLSKSAVQVAIRVLRRRRLLRARRATVTSTPEYEVRRPWASHSAAGRASAASVRRPERGS